MNNQDASTQATGEEPPTPVYALLVTNDEITILDVDPTQPILGQVSNAVPDAVADGPIFPPLRDVEVHRCAAWEEPTTIVALVLEWGQSMEDLTVNYPAWACYGRSPIVGPAVLMHDSTEAGQPVEIPPDVVEQIRSGPLPELRETMDGLLANHPDFAHWADRR